MLLKRLRVAQLRAFEDAELGFHPRMNIIMGVNGVGKSTILDALRYLLSDVLRAVSAVPVSRNDFRVDDITVGKSSLTTSLACDILGASFTYTLHKPREEALPDPEREHEVRHQVVKTPTLTEWVADPGHEADARSVAAALRKVDFQPLAVYFAPQRSILDSSKSSRRASRGREAALSAALYPRPLHAVDFAEWWLGRESLAAEGMAGPRAVLDALNVTASTFLESCRGLRAVSDPKPALLIEKNGTTLDVRQLSDGERGVLALVLDLTRRLSQANPQLEDPAREGSAIVLIDELDLHLHPGWQRKIVHRLLLTFPRCQFIATTHSPQIVSEVEPEQLQLLERSEDHIVVRRLPQSYGLESSWILEHLMDVTSRPQPSRRLISQIEDALDEGDLEAARTHLSRLRTMLHGDDADVVRLEASIDTIEALTDAVDTEGE